MTAHQSSDAANASRSGGVNNQTGTLGATEHKPSSIGGAGSVPPKGTSNGGK